MARWAQPCSPPDSAPWCPDDRHEPSCLPNCFFSKKTVESIAVNVTVFGALRLCLLGAKLLLQTADSICVATSQEWECVSNLRPSQNPTEWPFWAVRCFALLSFTELQYIKSQPPPPTPPHPLPCSVQGLQSVQLECLRGCQPDET